MTTEVDSREYFLLLLFLVILIKIFNFKSKGMDKKEQYKSLISEVIAKQSIILGPEIAVLKARSVKNLTINNEGEVTAIKGDPEKILQGLVDAYVDLSGQIVKSALGSIFTKYPEVKRIN